MLVQIQHAFIERRLSNSQDNAALQAIFLQNSWNFGISFKNASHLQKNAFNFYIYRAIFSDLLVDKNKINCLYIYVHQIG